MKKLLSLALYAALFSLTIACGSDPEEFQPAPTGKTPIALQATLADYGRATDTLFEEGDQIGLYIFTSETYIDNGLYTIKEGALQSNGARYWYEDKTIESTLVAYYPYASAWKYNAEGVTFTVREDQTEPQSLLRFGSDGGYHHREAHLGGGNPSFPSRPLEGDPQDQQPARRGDPRGLDLECVG